MHLFSWVLFGLLVRRLYRLKGDRYADRWVRAPPDLLIVPIVTLFNAEDRRVKGRVYLRAVQYRLGLAVDFIADRGFVSARRRDQEIERLAPGITGILGHRVKQFAGLLREQLIKDEPRYV